MPDFEDALLRFDVSEQSLLTVLHRLESTKLVEASSSGSYEILPSHLAAIVEERMELEQKKHVAAERMLSRDLKLWQEIEAYMPRQHFERIHAARRQLRVSEAEAQLMLRCALLFHGGCHLNATRYWLGRTKSRTAKVETLLAALFGSSECARGSSATLLGDFPLREVQAQLHLVALRDESAQVREQAIRSLSRMKDVPLQESLVQEVLDSNSPYRTMAVEALKIFPDDTTLALLRRVVEEQSSPVELRNQAIRVCGLLATPEAVEALLEIAIQDDDEADRSEAGLVLGSLTQTPLVRHLVGRLRHERRLICGMKQMLSARAAIRSLQTAFTVFGVLIGEFVLHGVMLLSLGRLRWGVTFLLPGIAGELLFFSGQTTTGFLVWLSSGLISQLAATSIVLNERNEKKERQLAYRRYLGVALFAWNCFLVFPFLPGLAHLLTRRTRRGVELFGRALMGGLLLLIVVLLKSVFLMNDLPVLGPFLHVLRWIYLGTGVALIPWSYALDVCDVFKNTILFKEPQRRLKALYRKVAGSPAAVAIVLEELNGDQPQNCRWAARILAHYGRSMDAGLLIDYVMQRPRREVFQAVRSLTQMKTSAVCRLLYEKWATGDLAFRRIVVSILAGSPTQESLDTLRSLREQLNWTSRFRYAAAVWHFRFKVWPTALVMLVLLLLPLFGVLAREGHRSLAGGVHHFVAVVRSDGETDATRIDYAQRLARRDPAAALRTAGAVFAKSNASKELRLGMMTALGVVIHQTADREASFAAAQRLGSTLSDQREDLPIRQRALLVLSESAKRSTGMGMHSEILPYLQDLLLTTAAPLNFELRREAIDQLGRIGTAKAVQALEKLVRLKAGSSSEAADIASTSTPTLEDISKEVAGGTGKINPSEAAEARREAELKTRALQALGSIRSTAPGPQIHQIAEDAKSAFSVLLKLVDDSSLDPHLRSMAEKLASRFDPLGKLEHYSDQRQFDSVIQQGEALVRHEQHGSDGQRRSRARELLQAAYIETAKRFRSEKAPDRALTQIERALDLLPGDAQALRMQGLIYLDQNDLKNALTVMRTVAEKSGDAESQATLAYIYFQKSDLTHARASALNAIHRDPNYAWAYELLLGTYDREGQPKEAARQFEKLKDLYPESILPTLQLGFVYHEYLAVEDPAYYQKSCEQYSSLLSHRNPADALGIKANLVECFVTTGRYAEAITMSDALLQEASPEPILAVNVCFLRFAAATLQGKRGYREALRGLSRTYRSLPAGFKNNWSYRGTWRYIERAPAPIEDKELLYGMIELIQSKSAPKSIPHVSANRARIVAAALR